jgi:hypothetical protein
MSAFVLVVQWFRGGCQRAVHLAHMCKIMPQLLQQRPLPPPQLATFHTPLDTL